MRSFSHILYLKTERDSTVWFLAKNDLLKIHNIVVSSKIVKTKGQLLHWDSSVIWVVWQFNPMKPDKQRFQNVFAGKSATGDNVRIRRVL